MKKSFEGKIHLDVPDDWDTLAKKTPLPASTLETLKTASGTVFHCVVHPEYVCTEYNMKLNLFTFGRLRLNIPFTVIAPPVSIDRRGFAGDFAALVGDYQKRRGLFLALNLERQPEIHGVAAAQTLSACIFHNRFASFDEYLSALRSGYRRRLLQALEKGNALTVRRVEPADFSGEMHALYLNVLKRSDYPLETLGMEFFQRLDGEIYAFYENERPLAFTALQYGSDTLDFVFGGMDYNRRDEFDLYYNMLLHILRLGIEKGVRAINFGQTAEHSKLRVGCVLSERYMAAFSGNRLLNRLLLLGCPFLGYAKPEAVYRCFKSHANR